MLIAFIANRLSSSAEHLSLIKEWRTANLSLFIDFLVLVKTSQKISRSRIKEKGHTYNCKALYLSIPLHVVNTSL